MGLVERCKVRARLEFIEREGMLYSDLSNTPFHVGVWMGTKKAISVTHLDVELCLVSSIVGGRVL